MPVCTAGVKRLIHTSTTVVDSKARGTRITSAGGGTLRPASIFTGWGLVHHSGAGSQLGFK